MSLIKKISPYLVSFLLLSLVVAAPFFVSAQTTQSGFVPCGNDLKAGECGFCDLIALIQNVFNFVVRISALVVTLLLAWAGIKLIVQGDSEGERDKAKKVLKDALIGFLIIILAGEIVNLILITLVKQDARPKGWWWGQGLRCERIYPNLSNGMTTGSGGVVSTTPSVGCPSCTALPSNVTTNSNSCVGETSSGRSACKVDPSLSLPLELSWKGFSEAGIKMNASETWPPVATNHSNPCHNSGTCIDASLDPSQRTGANITKAQQIFSNSNLRAQYEVQTDSRKKELEAQGATNVIVVPKINGEHFSVYKK